MVRFFATEDFWISLDELSCALESTVFELEAGTRENWESVLVTPMAGPPIGRIEHHDAAPGGKGSEIVTRCLQEIQGRKPHNAAEWLTRFLTAAQTIYVFQPLAGASIDGGWQELDSVASYLQHEHQGIFETPRGFTNEWGYHVLLRDDALLGGPMWLGLRIDQGWTHFCTDPATEPGLNAFLRGELPSGVKLAPRPNNPFDLYNPFEC